MKRERAGDSHRMYALYVFSDTPLLAPSRTEFGPLLASASLASASRMAQDSTIFDSSSPSWSSLSSSRATGSRNAFCNPRQIGSGADEDIDSVSLKNSHKHTFQADGEKAKAN